VGRIGVVLTLAAPMGSVRAKDKEAVSAKSNFYVYADKGARVNHFAPSGWMGDYGDIKIDDGFAENPADGRTCIKVSYSAKGTQGANWAGVYWQAPGEQLGR